MTATRPQVDSETVTSTIPSGNQENIKRRRPIDPRTPPCEMLVAGKLCGRTDDRRTILDRVLGIICLSHRPGFEIRTPTARREQP